MNDQDDFSLLKNLRETIRQKKEEIEGDLKQVEENIKTLESEYLEKTEKCGNIIKGWDSIFTAKPKPTQMVATNSKKAKFSNNEYIFSLSSITNPIKKDDNLTTSGKHKNNYAQMNNGMKISSSLKRKKKQNISFKKKKLSAISNNKHDSSSH